MTKQKIFGTDGVRGTANIEPVTAETALKLGRAAAHVFKTVATQAPGRDRHKIVIGKDTRLSGYMLENAISAGVLSMGVDVLFIGPLPTPGVAYVTRSLRADAGIVITASHNPYDDNGIKFFRSDGYKLDDNIEGQIEQLVFSGEIENIRPTASAIGKAVRIDDALGRYIEYAKASFPRRMTLEGMRIVVDCGNGAAYKATPCVLRELGADVIVYGIHPDGTNINRDCGSMHPETMCAKVREHGAHIGIAHDGDADRVLLCDETGTLIDGDDIMVIAALDMLARGTATPDAVDALYTYNAVTRFVDAMPLGALLVKPANSLVWLGATLVSFLAMPWQLGRSTRSVATSVLPVLWLTGIVSYLAQSRGFMYHLAPSFLALAGGLAIALTHAASGRLRLARHRVGASGLAALAAAVALGLGYRLFDSYQALPDALLRADYKRHLSRFGAGDGVTVADAVAFVVKTDQLAAQECLL